MSGYQSPFTGQQVDSAISACISGSIVSSANAYTDAAISSAISSGGHITVNNVGALGSGNLVLAGGLLDISSGGIDSGATVYSGGTLTVNPGGTAANITLSGGNCTVSSSGLVNNIFAASGGGVLIYAGAVNNLSGAGFTTIYNAGVISGAYVSGGGLHVLGGGSAVDVTVLKAPTTGNALRVSSGGYCCDVTQYEGTVNIMYGATLAGYTICYGGYQQITADASNVVISSGHLIPGTLGSITNMRFYQGIVSATNKAITSSYFGGGSSYNQVGVWSGCAFESNTLLPSAAVTLRSGAVMLSTIIEGGGAMLSSGASALVTAINAGGMTILDGGFADIVVVASGASLTVTSGASALAVTSNAGATVTVRDGGYIEYA